jgi:ABC-type Na+ efflux pump permease subunit
VPSGQSTGSAGKILPLIQVALIGLMVHLLCLVHSTRKASILYAARHHFTSRWMSA